MAFDWDDLDEVAPIKDKDPKPILSSSATQPQLPSEVKSLFGPAVGKTLVEDIVVPGNRKLRVATISDIHVDTPLNRKWLEKHLPKRGGSSYNVLILPGDVSDDLGKLRDTLQMLLRSFDLVCYTPGNHDIWVVRQGSPPDSMTKLRKVLEVCEECGARTGPLRLRGGAGASDVYLVPLLSFYTDCWDREPDPPWMPEEQKSMEAWMDFRAIKWPTELVAEVERRNGGFLFGSEGTSPAISELFAMINEPFLEEITRVTQSAPSGAQPVLISYSHYLPRQELFPEKRFLVDGTLHKVSGSRALEKQIRRLRPHVHIFGHTHLTVDLELEGQRYVQWALGTPSEQRAMTRAVGDTGMLVLYDASGEAPHVAPVQETFWGRFFAKSPRNPSETCPASFVRMLFARKYPDLKLPFDDEHFQKKTPNPGAPIENYEGLYDPRWRL